MTERLHPAQRPGATTLIPGVIRSAALLALLCSLAGCRHKATFVLPQPGQITILLETLPDPDPPPVIEPIQMDTDLDLPEAQLPAVRTARRRPAPAPRDASPLPTEAPMAAEPSAELAIGELSTGGESSPQSQQTARDLIADIQKRLNALSAKSASQQRAPVRQVRYFLKESQQALQSGDADGARTLATKAKLLLDDLEKK